MFLIDVIVSIDVSVFVKHTKSSITEVSHLRRAIIIIIIIIIKHFNVLWFKIWIANELPFLRIFFVVVVFQILTCIEKVWFHPDITSVVDWSLKINLMNIIMEKQKQLCDCHCVSL